MAHKRRRVGGELFSLGQTPERALCVLVVDQCSSTCPKDARGICESPGRHGVDAPDSKSSLSYAHPTLRSVHSKAVVSAPPPTSLLHKLLPYASAGYGVYGKDSPSCAFDMMLGAYDRSQRSQCEVPQHLVARVKKKNVKPGGRQCRVLLGQPLFADGHYPDGWAQATCTVLLPARADKQVLSSTREHSHIIRVRRYSATMMDRQSAVWEAIGQFCGPDGGGSGNNGVVSGNGGRNGSCSGASANGGVDGGIKGEDDGDAGVSKGEGDVGVSKGEGDVGVSKGEGDVGVSKGEGDEGKRANEQTNVKDSATQCTLLVLVVCVKCEGRSRIAIADDILAHLGRDARQCEDIPQCVTRLCQTQRLILSMAFAPDLMGVCGRVGRTRDPGKCEDMMRAFLPRQSCQLVTGQWTSPPSLHPWLWYAHIHPHLLRSLRSVGPSQARWFAVDGMVPVDAVLPALLFKCGRVGKYGS